jgi:hypothetical protein
MSLKKISLGVVSAVLALAVMASSASATISTTAAQWYIGPAPGTTLALGTSKGIGGQATTNWVLTTEIGGLPVELDSTAFDCVGCKIENKSVTEKVPPIAYGEGRILFTNVTVKKPLNCVVSGTNPPGVLVAGQILTSELVIHADWMDTSRGGTGEPPVNNHAFVQVIPKAGAATTFAHFELSGGECAAIGGTKNVTGSLYGESVNNTGVAALEQRLLFSPAIQNTAGGALFVGTKPANLSGSGNFFISPTKELFNVH